MNKKTFNNLYRADIIDRDGNYLGKTISSIDIGISPSKVIDEDKLLIKFEIYFSKQKLFLKIKKKLKKEIFLF